MVRILKWFVFISQPSLTNERSPRPAYATALPNTIRCASAGPCLPGRDRCQPIEARRWVRDPAAVLGGGFTRPLYPVNPHAKTIDGLDCYPSIGAILEGGGQLLPCLLRESSRSLSPAAGGSEAFGWVWSRLNRGSAAACGRRRTYTNETTNETKRSLIAARLDRAQNNQPAPTRWACRPVSYTLQRVQKVRGHRGYRQWSCGEGSAVVGCRRGARTAR
jgi:hypothetical protein